jgi:hypothetical protein
MRRLGACLGLLALWACGGSQVSTVGVEEVLELSACPEGSVCQKVADGRSRVTVLACIPESVRTPRADAQLTLTLSAGRWEGQDATSRTVSASVQNERCFSPTFITGTDLARVRVDAEVQGFRKFIEVELRPAPLTELELVPSPLRPRAGQEAQLQVRVRAANSGTPTLGTLVAFSVEDVEPATGQAFISPASTQVDATGVALGRLVLSSEVTRLTVRVRASPPGPGEASLERTFVLTAAP